MGMLPEKSVNRVLEARKIVEARRVRQPQLLSMEHDQLREIMHVCMYCTLDNRQELTYRPSAHIRNLVL